MKFLSFMNTRAGRGIRALMGVAVLIAGALVGGGVGLALMVFSILPFATAVFGVCPFDPLFGQPMRACAVSPARSGHARRS